MKGLFVTFEGPDGSGKTTVGKLVEKKLIGMHYDVLKTREPGGSPISEKLREIILDFGNEAMDGKTEVLLLAAARRQHVVDTIRPALAANKIVLSDRFVDSSLAYQAGGRNLDRKEILMVNQYAIEDTEPARTYYLDVPAEVGLRRIAANKQREVNRLDKEDIGYHERVQLAYKWLIQQYPARFMQINGLDSPEIIADRIVADICENYKQQNLDKSRYEKGREHE